MSSRASFDPGLGMNAALIAMLLTACATQAPEPVTIENIKEVSATVESIDVDTRMVVLRRSDGEKLTVQVSPEVRNLAQVTSGDRVVARYYESLAAELRHRGDGSGETEAPVVESAVGRAEPGAKPGAVAGKQISQTVRINGVDKKTHVVSFYGSDGLARSIAVRTPEGQEFASKLKAGDEVELTYTEAIAVSLEPSK
jgi:hypothetical protein